MNRLLPAIRYMNNLKGIILITCYSCIFSSRHVEDTLPITSSWGKTIVLYQMFPNVDMHIKLEHPDQSEGLFLLDFPHRFTVEVSIHTDFFRKATSRNVLRIIDQLYLTGLRLHAGIMK